MAKARTAREVPALAEQIDWDKPVKFLWLQGLVDRSIQRELQQLVAPHGLSIPEYSTLAVLYMTPKISNADLARQSLVTPQSMNEVIGRLESRKLIERQSHPDHGRILLIDITPAGRATFTAAMADVAAFEAELISGIPEEDLDRTKDALTAVLARLLDRAQAD